MDNVNIVIFNILLNKVNSFIIDRDSLFLIKYDFFLE